MTSRTSKPRTWMGCLIGVALIVAVTGFVGPFDRAPFVGGSADDQASAAGGRQANVLGAVELPHADGSVFIADAVTIERDTIPAAASPTTTPTATSPTTTPAATSPTTTPATVPPTTTAPTTVPPTTTAPNNALPDAEPSRFDIGWEGINQVDYPWRDTFPDWTVTVESARDGVRALTFPSSKRVEIYVRSTDTPASIARVFAHELGHVIDIGQNTDDDRQRWREVRGVPASVPWWPTGSTYDFDTLAGDFAEAFAVWKVGASSQSRVGGGYTAEQLAVMAQLAG